MTAASGVSPRLLLAYRQTTYRAGAVTVRIGRRSPAMDRLLATHHARCAVFVTAWNPYSRRMPPGWNRRMQQRLRQRLRRHVVLAGCGGAGRWREDHLLVLADLRIVAGQARAFRQNAVVAVLRGGRAALHLTGGAMHPSGPRP